MLEVLHREPGKAVGGHADVEVSVSLQRAYAAHLNFGLDILDCVRALHLQGDRFACQSLHEDLHL